MVDTTLPPVTGQAPSGSSVPSPKAAGRRHVGLPWRVRLRRDRSLIVMTLPALILLVVFSYIPMVGLITAFQDYNVYSGFLHSPWVGISQFTELFGDPAFWQAFVNTIGIFAVQLILFFPCPIIFALVLDSLLSRRLKSLLQSVTALPHFFSWVLVVTLFEQMLGGAGLVPTFLRHHGISNPWNVMTDPGTFKLLASAQLIWKETGWSAIIYMAALAGINPELYEACAVDGGGRWRRVRHVSLPGLKPIAILLLILNLGYALSFGFEQMLLQLGAVGPGAAQVLSVYSYEYGIVQGQYSFGAAAGLFLGVASAILLLAANKVAHMFGEDGLYRR